MKKKPSKIPFTGAIAGIMEHCVMYPLDSVKVRFTVKKFVSEKKCLEI